DTAIFVPPDVSHEAWYPPNAPHGRHLWILIMPNYLQYNLFSIDGAGVARDQNIGGFHCFSPYNHQQLVAAWDMAERNDGAPESLAELSLLVNLQAVRLVRLYQGALHDEAHGTEMHNRLLVANATEYIDLQCGRDCSIDLLAKRIGCSRTHFTRIFRQYAGCSVLEYVNRQRLKHYRSMRPDTPVKIFAQELGFSSASAFIHWRKQNVRSNEYEDFGTLTEPEK
ncbi:MAG: helix-turn-helix transcriptional regulator, partial [Lentisphaeria bacterium]|nr:helix-turn-helix transcriptional regulator [Lentisphaeria bacterium]